MWDDEFEQIVRRQVPFFPAEQPLREDDSLQDYGLDSFGIIELLVAIERTYQVEFRDEAMNRQTFATPGSLWATVSGLLATTG